MEVAEIKYEGDCAVDHLVLQEIAINLRFWTFMMTFFKLRSKFLMSQMGHRSQMQRTATMVNAAHRKKGLLCNVPIYL